MTSPTFFDDPVRVDILPLPDTYAEDQRQVITEALASIPASDIEEDVRWSRDGVLVSRVEERARIEPFAAFPAEGRAYRVLSRRVEDRLEGEVWEYVPVLVNGCAVLQVHEYNTGVLHLMRRLRKRGTPVAAPRWMATYLGAGGWLRTAELAWSTAEINARVTDEYASGRLTVVPERG